MNATAPALDSATRYTLDRRRVFIFPTRHGFMLGCMLFVILLGSINYDNALGYLLTFLLFGLFLVSMLHAYRNLTRLSYLGAHAKPVFAGQQAVFILGFDNRALWPRYSLELASWPRLKNRFRRRQRGPGTFVATLDPTGITHASLALSAPRRGTLNLSRVRISSTFPLGVLRAWAYFENDATCLVYPRPHGRLPLPAAASSAAANLHGAGPGNDDFAGFRTYQPGDPIRAIAWKTLARQDAVLVKRFSGGAPRHVYLRWSDCAPLETEARLSQLAQWVVDADRSGTPYVLDIPRMQIAPATGATHRHECLRALALYAP
jgi:uncharacterized protein (DUF58 family)